MIKPSIIKRYNNLMCDSGYDHCTIGTRWSESTEDWNLSDMVLESQWILDCYNEEGHADHDLKYEDYKYWKSKTDKLQRFINRYKDNLKIEKPSTRHCSSLEH